MGGIAHENSYGCQLTDGRWCEMTILYSTIYFIIDDDRAHEFQYAISPRIMYELLMTFLCNINSHDEIGHSNYDIWVQYNGSELKVISFDYDTGESLIEGINKLFGEV